ncbi:hypothetical protein MSG28_009894 [Choristoneura fumiferana]|uniref:Uncharacterized protein n=1 Tax=Choristoneura fumiferana TaxID=7141 RepID=A0ACC0JCV6_CHOFU|nr:hypothetical protein MSG28_009894 [Choristoneura fumiferana]
MANEQVGLLMMRLFSIVFALALVMLASGEVHWDTSGQYRLVDEAPLSIKYAPAPIRYYGPMPRMLSEYRPFVYSYVQEDKY